jgi:hypothetical protein
MQIGVTALIMITTLAKGESNFMTILIKSGIIPVYKMKFTCEICTDKDTCEHVSIGSQPWKDEYKLVTIREIYKALGRLDDFRREIQGEFDEPDVSVFNPDLVLQLFTYPTMSIETSISHVYIAIDPCCGTDTLSGAQRSKYALVSACNTHGFCVLGMENMDATIGGVTIDDIIIRHIQHIYDNPRLSRAILVLLVEGNTGIEADRIYSMVRMKFTNNMRSNRVIVCMTDYSSNKQGMKINNETKHNMKYALQRMLQCKQIKFWDDCFSIDGDINQYKIELRDQMLRFRKVQLKTTSTTLQPRVTFNAKGDLKKELDDLVITLQWLCLGVNRFWSEPMYQAYHKGNLISLEVSLTT